MLLCDKMKNKKINNQAQAAVEMAIFGSLILICLSALITYGQRLDAQQQVKMEAFRLAMQKSWAKNSSVSYTLKRDERFFNLMAGFGEGQPSSVSSTASVMWQKGAPGPWKTTDEPAFSYYKINDELVGEKQGLQNEDTGILRGEKDSYGYDNSRQKSQKIPLSVYTEHSIKQTQYSTSMAKQEQGKPDAKPGKITNTRTSDLKEIVSTTALLRWDKKESHASETVHVPQYDYNQYPDPVTDTKKDIKPAIGTEGAYPNSTNQTDNNGIFPNRIGYSKDNVGGEQKPVHKQRSWNTDY